MQTARVGICPTRHAGSADGGGNGGWREDVRAAGRLPPPCRANEFAATSTRSPPARTGGCGPGVRLVRVAGVRAVDAVRQTPRAETGLMADRALADSFGQSGCGRAGAWDAACSPAAESAKADFVKFQRRIHSLTGRTRRSPIWIRNPQSAETIIRSGPTLAGIHPSLRRNPRPRGRYATAPAASNAGRAGHRRGWTSDTRNPHAPTDFRRRVRGIGGG
jgi:hypothetical protein